MERENALNTREVLSHKTIVLARAKFKRHIRDSVRNDIRSFPKDMQSMEELACIPRSGQSIDVVRTLNLVDAEINCLMEAYTRLNNTPIQDAVYAKFSFHIAYEFAKSRPRLFNEAFWLEVDSWQGIDSSIIRNVLRKLTRLCEQFVRDNKSIRDQSTGHRTSNSRAMSTYNVYFQLPFPLEDTVKLWAQVAVVRRHICQTMLKNAAYERAHSQSHSSKPLRF